MGPKELRTELAAVGLSWNELRDIHDSLSRRVFQKNSQTQHVSPDFLVIGLRNGKLGPSLALSKDQVAFITETPERTTAWVNSVFHEGGSLRKLFEEHLGTKPVMVAQFEESAGVFTHVAEEYVAEGSVPASAATESLVITLHTPPISIRIAHPIRYLPKKTCEFQDFPSLEIYLAGLEYSAAVLEQLKGGIKHH